VGVQLQFRNEFRRKPPHVNDIRRRFEQFKVTEKVIWKTCRYGSPDLTVFNYFSSGGTSRTLCKTEKYEICNI
jgi:hypothetical protein